MEDVSPNQVTTAEDWKRRFQRETKVNKELGRRLRETRHQLEEEKTRSQDLAVQLRHYKRHQHFGEEPAKQNGVCSNCERLEAELASLKRSIIDARYMTRHDATSASLTIISDIRLDHDEVCPEDHRSEFDQEDTNGFSPMNGEDPQPMIRESLCPSSPVKSLSKASLADAEDTLQIDEPEADESNQTDDGRRVFTDIDDTSLGELFKYAVVLAGPAPTKPKVKPRLSFTDRFKPLELPRTRNPQESMEQIEHQESPTESSSRPRSAPVGKKKATSPNGGSIWSLKRQSQAILDEERVSSPLRRAAAGFFSNLGLRSGGPSSAPSTPPLPPPPAPTKAATPPPPSPPPTSKLLCVYPPHAGEVQELEGLLEICFPYGEEPPLTRDFSLSQLKRSLQERHRTYRSPDSTFVLTIASASNPTEITYAICVRCPLFPDKEDEPADSTSDEAQTLADGPAQCCLCLLSPYPFFGLFFKVLYGIAVLWNTKRRQALMNKDTTPDSVATMLEKPLGMLDFVEVFQGVMERLKEMQIPSMGGWSRMLLSSKVTHLAFHRPHSESLVVERRHLLLEYAAPTLFGLLSVDQVLFLLGCLCSERKVLVVSDHVNIVSSCVLALITLLHPLQWAGPVITVLPPRLDELLEAPVPLIAGRVSINSASIRDFSTLDRPMKDVIEMNMDQNSLHMHDEDLITYHELKLPECDELVHELEPYSALLFGKHEALDFPTVQQDEACKIMCARIHHHIESICALAMAEKDTTAFIKNDYFDDRSDHSSSADSSPSRGSITRLGADRRCSAMVADYINRFQGTQMFSMFNLQAQDAQNESEDGDIDRDDSENDGHIEEEYHYEGR
ncbi:DENN (AEX-3) domain-containing protein [Phytophthora infestans]|uniref:DENN (AEX-3) domain-containing protein n=1 Tax=Phytophthora infestans TaxID=4787 RepID=A0A8S9TPH4_PHYIN|nr:DENN (AEX-3) domain-containing protein [Phytophthora infestans]KAF4148353.1 DENN (AEX-3) domain-containing protein [Phytophthora infestans]